MTSSHEAGEELGSRLDRLESDFRKLASRVSRAEREGDSAMSRISFVDWLRISGPTFAVMVFGFALLWNAQQTTSAQVVDVARTFGRLEGTLDGVDRRLEALDARLDRLGASVERLGERISELGSS
jgi:chaperonin cofactor prefoldin